MWEWDGESGVGVRGDGVAGALYGEWVLGDAELYGDGVAGPGGVFVEWDVFGGVGVAGWVHDHEHQDGVVLGE